MPVDYPEKLGFIGSGRSNQALLNNHFYYGYVAQLELELIPSGLGHLAELIQVWIQCAGSDLVK